MESILARTPFSPGQKLVVDLISNPRAGGYLRPRFALRRRRELASVVDSASSLPLRSSPWKLTLHLTQRSGHAYDIADRIIKASADDDPDTVRLLITAGGDGTSLETAARLVEVPAPDRHRYGLLRLPLGTGNDGSEGRDLVTALGRLLAPSRLEPRAAILVTPAPQGGIKPVWSFNIASVGLDAYVARTTNHLKSVFPGDSYKLMVNIASVLYDRIYKVLPMTVRARSKDTAWRQYGPEELLLLALGVSGDRQYGSNKKILPGTENVCAIRQTSLFRKLLVKGMIERGVHDKVREVLHYSADILDIDYNERIILQCDGEVVDLEPSDFPLRMEIKPTMYNVLVPS